jgi:mRNA interferase RelE/StbE
VTYRLVYTKRAVRDFKKLDQQSLSRIKRALERYVEDPLRYAEALTSPELGTYRFRIGDYRLIFDIEGDEIVILRVGHRREIYRRL